MRPKNEKKQYEEEKEAVRTLSIFDEDDEAEDKNTWSKEWNDMPEFIQENDPPFEYIKVCFRSIDDRKAFAKLTNLTVTEKTRTIWFPALIERRGMDKNVEYIDEIEEEERF